MKLSFIAPTKFISTISVQGDFVLALSHLMDNDCINEYSQAIRNTGLPVYLDNGLFELGQPEDLESLINKAIKMSARYVFAPDHLYDGEATLRSLSQFIALAKIKGFRGGIAGVVQAKGVDEFLDIFKEMHNNSDVALIGLSILACPKVFYERSISRDVATNRIFAMDAIAKTFKDPKAVHLLGLGDSLEDLIYGAKTYNWIKSNDSSSAFMCGLKHKTYDEYGHIDGGKPKDKVDFDLSQITSEQLKTINQNILNLRNHVTTTTPNRLLFGGRG